MKTGQLEKLWRCIFLECSWEEWIRRVQEAGSQFNARLSEREEAVSLLSFANKEGLIRYSGQHNDQGEMIWCLHLPEPSAEKQPHDSEFFEAMAMASGQTI